MQIIRIKHKGKVARAAKSAKEIFDFSLVILPIIFIAWLGLRAWAGVPVTIQDIAGWL